MNIIEVKHVPTLENQLQWLQLLLKIHHRQPLVGLVRIAILKQLGLQPHFEKLEARKPMASDGGEFKIIFSASGPSQL